MGAQMGIKTEMKGLHGSPLPAPRPINSATLSSPEQQIQKKKKQQQLTNKLVCNTDATAMKWNFKKIHIYYFIFHKEKVLDHVSIVEQKVDLTGLTHFKALIKKYVRPSGTPDYRKLHLYRWNLLIKHPEMSAHDAAVCILQASPLRFAYLFSCSIAVWPLDATKSCLLTF